MKGIWKERVEQVLFLVFALDPNSQYCPYPAVNQVLCILGDVFDRSNGWALASWVHQPEQLSR